VREASLRAATQEATRFGTEAAAAEHPRARFPADEDVPPAVRAALHVDEKVQRAILAFMRAQEHGGSIVICDMCCEARNTHLDTSADLGHVSGCNPFVTAPWDAKVRPSPCLRHDI